MDHVDRRYANAGLQKTGSSLGEVLLKAALVQVGELLRLDRRHLSRLIKTYKRLCFDPDAYQSFRQKKKLGGWRVIEAPNADLKMFQTLILRNLLMPVYEPSRICHSASGRNILSNALHHLGVPLDVDDPDPSDEDIPWRFPRSILSIDIKGAFPSVQEDRVEDILWNLLGENTPEAVIAVMLKILTWRGSIPQGAPTSPILLNLACRDLDLALIREFERGPFRVTRYVDDITVSSVHGSISERKRQLLIDLVTEHGFIINERKTWLARERSHVLRITGLNLVPNWRTVRLPASTISKFRSRLRGLYKNLRTEQLNFVTAIEEGVNPRELFFLQRKFPREQKRRFGELMGILGFCLLIHTYWPLPNRLLSWSRKGDAENLIRAARFCLRHDLTREEVLKASQTAFSSG